MIGADTAKQERQGWLVLAGAVVLCALLALFAAPDDVGAAAGDEGTQGQLLSELIRAQGHENDVLVKNLAELKHGVGFTVRREFTVPEEELAYSRQPGLFFHDRRNETIQKLDNRAHEKGIGVWDKNLGFSNSTGTVPPRQPPANEDADSLLLLLQVTKRVVSICLETPTPLNEIQVVPHGQNPADIAKLVRVVAPPGRPPLFREYSVSLKLKGSLSDILWVVHRLSPGRDEAEQDFPLVLKSFTLTSDNIDLGKPIPQLNIVMTVAGLSFIDDKDRGAASVRRPGTAASPVTASPAAASDDGDVEQPVAKPAPSPAARSF